jgi:hypothetical protein
MNFVRELAFGELRGFSCAYRNHTNEELHDESPMLHGYSLSFFFRFVSLDQAIMTEYLNEKMAWIGQFLEEIFRNTVIVAHEDPLLDAFLALEKAGACELRMIDTVGAEAFAKILYEDFAPTVKECSAGSIALFEVKVRENGNYTAAFIDAHAHERNTVVKTA